MTTVCEAEKEVLVEEVQLRQLSLMVSQRNEIHSHLYVMKGIYTCTWQVRLSPSQRHFERPDIKGIPHLRTSLIARFRILFSTTDRRPVPLGAARVDSL
jgi:hypothetical protein